MNELQMMLIKLEGEMFCSLCDSNPGRLAQ